MRPGTTPEAQTPGGVPSGVSGVSGRLSRRAGAPRACSLRPRQEPPHRPLGGAFAIRCARTLHTRPSQIGSSRCRGGQRAETASPRAWSRPGLRLPVVAIDRAQPGPERTVPSAAQGRSRCGGRRAQAGSDRGCGRMAAFEGAPAEHDARRSGRPGHRKLPKGHRRVAWAEGSLRAAFCEPVHRAGRSREAPVASRQRHAAAPGALPAGHSVGEAPSSQATGAPGTRLSSPRTEYHFIVLMRGFRVVFAEPRSR